MKRGKYKYCPRCGKANDINDAYCIRCGYSFRGKQHKKIGLKKIIIGALIMLVAWIVIRIITKQPIIPDWLNGFVKSFTGTNSSK